MRETQKQKGVKQLRGRGLRLFLALVLSLLLQGAMAVQAAEPGTTRNLGENGGIAWTYNRGTKTLTVSGQDELFGTEYESPFADICQEKQVENIVFDNCKLTGSAEYLFLGLYSVKKIDLSGLDTGKVTNMGYMFSGCWGLSSLNVSGLDTGNVTDMGGMFEYCSSLSSLDLSSF